MRSFLYALILVVGGVYSSATTTAAEENFTILLDSCHLEGLEQADDMQYKLAIAEYREGDELPVLFAGITYGKNGGQVRAQRMRPDDDFLREMITVLGENLDRFETGESSFASIERAERFLAIERPYYTAVQETAHSVDVFRYAALGPGYVYDFRDKEGVRVGVYVFDGSFQIANFCML